jgi:hypothetical protein
MVGVSMEIEKLTTFLQVLSVSYGYYSYKWSY